MKYWILSASLWLAPAFADTSSESWTLRYTEYGQWITERIERAEDGWPEIDSRVASVESRNFKENVPMGQGEELRGLASDELWSATQKWDLAWEDKFAHWIATEVDVDFFQKYKISTDCADVEYALRWIFARNNGLEMAVRLKGTGDYFTHRSVRSSWRNLPTATEWFKDQKFLAALNYMLTMTFTHTLMKDSYPVAVIPETMKPGTFHLELHGTSGHTQVIYRSQNENRNQLLPFLIFQSTVPRVVRALMPDGFWQIIKPIENERGLMRMRWPDFSSGKVQLIVAEEMPHYSLEQFQPSFFRSGVSSFYEEVYLRLNPNLRMDQVALEGARSLQTLFRSRQLAVEQGYAFCSTNPCEPGSGNYDNWSTPSRDSRIFEIIRLLEMLAMRGSSNPPLDAMMAEPFLDFSGDKFNLLQLIDAWRGVAYSSDPRDLPERRWGITGGGIQLWLRDLFGKVSEQREKILNRKEEAAPIDVQFARGHYYFKRYCAQATRQNCQFVTSMAESETVEIGKEKLNFRQWIDRIPWFVSSTDRERRWGSHSKDFTFLKVSDKNPTLQNTGYQLSRYTWGWRIVKAAPGGDLFVRQQVQTGPVTILENEPTVIWSQGTKINVDLLSGATKTQLNINFVPTDIITFGNAFVVADVKSGKFAIGESRNGRRRWIDQGDAIWLSGDFNNKTLGYDRYKVFSYGTSQGSKVWDFSGAEPKSYLVSSLSAHTPFVNSKSYIGFRGGGVLVKRTGQFLNRAEAPRIMQCHPSGKTCVVNTGQAGSLYGFYAVTDQGEFLPKFSFGGEYLAIDAEYLVEWKASQQFKTYRWTETEAEEVRPLPDEQAVVGVLGEFVFSRLKNEQTRVRRGNQEIFKGSGMLSGFGRSEINEGYFELFELSTGRISLRSLAKPKELITNAMIMQTAAGTSRWLTGYQSFAGQWVF